MIIFWSKIANMKGALTHHQVGVNVTTPCLSLPPSSRHPRTVLKTKDSLFKIL